MQSTNQGGKTGVGGWWLVVVRQNSLATQNSTGEADRKVNTIGHRVENGGTTQARLKAHDKCL